jgi:cobalt-zinc-cadmium efflux system outer membrane protein
LRPRSAALQHIALRHAVEGQVLILASHHRSAKIQSSSVGAESFASATINITIWNRNQGNVGAAKAEIERAQQDVTREQLSLRRQAAPLAQSYETAKFEAERYKTQLIPRSARAYELYLKK